MSMNIFRLAGDMCHIVSLILLVWKLKVSKNCLGISCRMLELYLMVFVCRYVDLFIYFISFYNTFMKILFILVTAYSIYLIRFRPPISQTYNRKIDKFSYEKYILGPVFVLALLTTKRYDFVDVLWTFSIWLESVAILPQLTMLYQQREVENITSHYVLTMGLYRGFYLINWIYRYLFESPSYICLVCWTAGFIQTALYVDFFYYFAKSKWYGKKLVLPFTGDV
ncbi:er lumen protein retaining receptor, putative [Theileria equi strain WA]|uniref:ER lumen protein-retaining receptor n=1 Tax=Theileria equi strain WA TaxID=1537102 RepID=L0B1F8_THEEQ|nr:er lumen protein retaining receptor, putative [Theileria equi strain WA]AFZ81665.1 er lumen protein retaining receptor, putative [Theileria equi strain WA]|eukprot:XP_004831331.1 er lumen protein retaining receptor, putative [Theileria equi strain WA]